MPVVSHPLGQMAKIVTGASAIPIWTPGGCPWPDSRPHKAVEFMCAMLAIITT